MARKITAIILCALLTAVLFAGCGDGGTTTAGASDGTTGGTTAGTTAAPSTTAPDVTSSVPAGTYKIFIGGEQAEDTIDPVTGVLIKGWNSVAKEFVDQNPGVVLEFTEIPWSDYIAKLETACQSGEFDVVHLAAGMNRSTANAGTTISLNPYIEKDTDFDPVAIYGEGVWDSSAIVIGGQRHGLPKLGYTFTHLYNKQILDDFGVTKYPDENTTWEEILEIAQQCTGTNPRTGTKTYGIFMRGGGTTFAECAQYMCSTTDYYFNWDATDGNTGDIGTIEWTIEGNQGIIKALDWMKAAAACAPPGWLTSEGMENFFTEDADIAMWMDTDGGGMPKALYDAGELELLSNYVFFPVPGYKDTKHDNRLMRSSGNFHTWGIPAAAKDKDASYEIVKFLASEYVSRQAYEQKWLTPVLPSALEWLDPLDPYSAVCIKYLAETYPYPEVTQLSAYATYNNHIKDLFAQYALGDVADVVPELARIQSEMETWRDSAVANGTR